MAGPYTFTTADNGRVLAFPLRHADGTPNDFTNSTALLRIRDQGNILSVRALTWNTVTMQWEYAITAGEFPAGRYWAEVAVMFGSVGPIYSSEVIWDVVSPD